MIQKTVLPPAPPAVICDACNGTTVILETPRICKCVCHSGAAAVAGQLEKRALDGRAAAQMLLAIMAGKDYCTSCREIHACTICGGQGTL